MARIKKEVAQFHDIVADSPNYFKGVVMRDVGCRLYDETRRLETIIAGTLLEEDCDLKELIPQLKQLTSKFLRENETDIDDLKKWIRNTKIKALEWMRQDEDENC